MHQRSDTGHGRDFCARLRHLRTAQELTQEAPDHVPPRSQVPPPPDPLIGRAADLRRLVAALSAGGSGKTRLAAAAASQPIALDEFAVLAGLVLLTLPDAAATALASHQQPADRSQAAEAAARAFPPDQPAAPLALFHPAPGPARGV